MTRGHLFLAASTVAVVALAAMALVHPENANAAKVVTVGLGIRYSHFSRSEITVRKGTTVRFVVTNGDPILHELIVGPPEVQQRHEAGTEAAHPPRPGEVTITPGSKASTDYFFASEGSIEFACHLPGHHAYGMTGQVRVVPS